MLWRRLTLLTTAVLAVGCTPGPRGTRGPNARSQPAAETIAAATSGDYPPLSVWPADRAKPGGFGPALLEGFAATRERPVRWERFTWPTLTTNMQAGRYDVVADGLTVRPERSIRGRFTVPIARGGAVLLFRRPTWATASATIADLDRPTFRIAVNRGGHLERVTRGLFPKAAVQAIADNPAVPDALARGEVDGVMTNTFEAPRWAARFEGAGIERLGPLTDDVTALWVRDGQRELAEQLDQWLLAEEASGRLDVLRRELLGPGGGGPAAMVLDAILAATIERLSLMPFVAAAKGPTGREVTDVVQEAKVVALALEATRAAARKVGIAPPAEDATLDFFRAQIEAAKDVQRGATTGAEPAPYDLETELRPAIGRITARIAFLVVRLPRDVPEDVVVERTRKTLAASAVRDENITRLATATARLAGR